MRAGVEMKNVKKKLEQSYMRGIASHDSAFMWKKTKTK